MGFFDDLKRATANTGLTLNKVVAESTGVNLLAEKLKAGGDTYGATDAQLDQATQEASMETYEGGDFVLGSAVDGMAVGYERDTDYSSGEVVVTETGTASTGTGLMTKTTTTGYQTGERAVSKTEYAVDGQTRDKSGISSGLGIEDEAGFLQTVDKIFRPPKKADSYFGNIESGYGNEVEALDSGKIGLIAASVVILGGLLFAVVSQ